MVLGAIGYHGRSNLVIIDWILNSMQYADILEQNLLIFTICNTMGDYIFQKDNCPTHKSHAVSH